MQLVAATLQLDHDGTPQVFVEGQNVDSIPDGVMRGHFRPDESETPEPELRSKSIPGTSEHLLNVRTLQ
jgi:hypothetical protein